MGPLATALFSLGFIPALGTIEKGFHGDATPVVKGKRKMYDSCNGVLVIYDELGAPWIIRCDLLEEGSLKEIISKHRLGKGIYVPYANDGGRFFRDHKLPTSTSC